MVQKISPKYPDASAKAGIQGAVVLKIVIDATGAVQDVSVASGDSTLAQAASDAVRQWKYNPYLIDGAPAEIETYVTLNFHLASQPQTSAPPLGDFRGNTYTNEYFNLTYPLPREWLRMTDLVRNEFASEKQSHATYVLLAAVHIPQDVTELRADSSFTVQAVGRSTNTATENCRQYLDTLASVVLASQSAKKKGEVSEYTIAGHEFSRANFEYRSGVSDHALICSTAKNYLLLWNIEGLAWDAVNNAASTINAIVPWPTEGKPSTRPAESSKPPTHVRVTEGVTTGLLLKRVAPIYPPQARRNHIQGTVRLRVLISKTGDIEDLELIAGPIELAVSAVNAVRQWKYRPYLLKGEPIAVNTEIVVNYTLTM